GVNQALAAINAQLDAFGDRLRERAISDLKKCYTVEARYRFQVWELDVPVLRDHFDEQAEVEALVQEFHRVHERIFAVSDRHNAVEFLNWRGRLIAKVNAPTLEPARTPAGQVVNPDRSRRCYFADAHLDTAIYLGGKLPVGAVLTGPAIIEEDTSTLVIYPGATARVSPGGRYLVSPPVEIGYE
ncbi:MAG: hypothetical protein ACREXT_04485, partial [Gammaproteobacteria bacterium]